MKATSWETWATHWQALTRELLPALLLLLALLLGSFFISQLWALLSCLTGWLLLLLPAAACLLAACCCLQGLEGPLPQPQPVEAGVRAAPPRAD